MTPIDSHYPQPMGSTDFCYQKAINDAITGPVCWSCLQWLGRLTGMLYQFETGFLMWLYKSIFRAKCHYKRKEFCEHKERVAENALRHPYSFAIRIHSRSLSAFSKPLLPGRSVAPCSAYTAHNARQRCCLIDHPMRIPP